MKAFWNCTAYDGKQMFTATKELSPVLDEQVEMNAINLYPEIEYQQFHGFGGALTEAAAYTYARMDATAKEAFLDAYFGPNGNQYRFVRMALDSCDFALGNYSAVEDPSDSDLATFSLARDERYILPLLRAAETRLGEKLQIMLTPWSPPAFMKSNGEKNNGGMLKPEYRERWAKYICRYIWEYRNLGFEVTMLSIQNEPLAKQTWDSCLFTGQEEKEFLRDYLHPALLEAGLGDIKVLIWDHNKERIVERAKAVITPDTVNMVDGLAFHWYSGDHFEALDIFRKLYPGKDLVFSEGCVEYSRFGAGDQLANARMYVHDIIGNLNSGMNLSLDWNLLLDETGGPNHVGNFCDAPVMYDTATGVLEKKLSFFYIGHLSRYIGKDAVRIGLSKYTDDIDAVAMRNQDNSLVTVLMNRKSEERKINLRVMGQVIAGTLPADSIATIQLEMDEQ